MSVIKSQSLRNANGWVWKNFAPSLLMRRACTHVDALTFDIVAFVRLSPFIFNAHLSCRGEQQSAEPVLLWMSSEAKQNFSKGKTWQQGGTLLNEVASKIATGFPSSTVNNEMQFLTTAPYRHLMYGCLWDRSGCISHKNYYAPHKILTLS